MKNYLRVHQFASEICLKPSQRDLVNFFDEYKLNTPDEKIPQINSNESHIYDQKGTKQQSELVNVADGVTTGKQAKRIFQAVSKAKLVEDPIDRIIIERITNCSIIDEI